MKKSLFGYNISEVNTILNSLREENKSLHSTITALKLKIQSIDSDSNAKSILLEEDLKIHEENLININNEKNDLEKKLNSLMEKYESNTKQKQELNNQIQSLHKENDILLKQLSELRKKTTKEDEYKGEVVQVDDKKQSVVSFHKELIRYMENSLENYRNLVNDNNKLNE